jgi:hypothetical protein
MNQGVAIAIPLSPRNIRIALDVASNIVSLNGHDESLKDINVNFFPIIVSLIIVSNRLLMLMKE